MMTVGFGGVSATRFGTAFPVQRKTYLVVLKDGANVEEVARKIQQELIKKMPMGNHLGQVTTLPEVGILTVNASLHMLASIKDLPEVLAVEEERTDLGPSGN